MPDIDGLFKTAAADSKSCGSNFFLEYAGYPGKLTSQPKRYGTYNKHGARDDQFFIPGKRFGPFSIANESQVIQEHGSGPAEHRIYKGAGKNTGSGALGILMVADHLHAGFKKRQEYAHDKGHPQNRFPHGKVHGVAEYTGHHAERCR